MIEIKVRENSKDNWWVSTTFNRIDKCFEDASMIYAKMQMTEWLQGQGVSVTEMNFLPPKRYESKGSKKPQSNWRRPFLDHNPQG